MYIPGSIEEITDLLNALPEDVTRVLGMPEETRANATLEKVSGLSEQALIRLNNFYLTIIAKKNPLSDISVYLKEQQKITDSNLTKSLLSNFAERLSWYGDYFPDLQKAAQEWGVSMPTGITLISDVRKALEKERMETERQEHSTAPTPIVREKLPLLSAIGKYPRLGEQQISSERIKVKNQPEPARPTLANWIRVYRDELGIGYHDPMVRGKFIFDSENGKRLKPEERERLNVVLRSIEENAPVDIDPEKPEIVFPTFAATPVPSRPAAVGDANTASTFRSLSSASTGFSGSPVSATSQPTAPVPPQAPPRKPVSFAPAPPQDLPVGGGAFSFSSTHSLPVESEGEGGFSIRQPEERALPSGRTAFGDSATSLSSSAQPQDMNPFHIHPVSAKRKPIDTDDASGRVIDLRS